MNPLRGIFRSLYIFTINYTLWVKHKITEIIPHSGCNYCNKKEN